MGTSVVPGSMTSEDVVRLARAHTFFSWSAQGAIDPIAIDRAEGIYLYTPEGRRIIDFNSQLMSVNIGHGDRRVIDAISAQAAKLQYVQPAFATEVRARLGAKLAEIMPGDLDKVFFTLGGAEAVENAIKLARHFTGRTKVLARYRTYHGATLGAMTLTGDPRRWANEPAIYGVVRYPDTHRWGEKEPRPAAEALAGPRGRHPLRGAAHDRGGLPGDDRRDQRHPHPARRVPGGRPRALRPLRDPDGRRRGDGGLRTDRQVVRRRPLGCRARPDDDGEGAHLQLPAPRRGGHAPSHRRVLRQQDVLRGPHVQQPPGEPGGLAGHDRGLRGGRAHREVRPRWARCCAATTRRSPRSTRAWEPPAAWACSGSSTSSAAATRASR